MARGKLSYDKWYVWNIAEDSYYAERTINGKTERWEGSSHCLQCAKVDVLVTYGGQVDLIAPNAFLIDQPNWIIDYKTKQTADKFKPGKMVYDEHGMQLAAYRKGLKLPRARCANVFICLEDGQIDFHEHKEEELQKGWEMFQCCLKLWQLQNQ